MNLSAIRKGEYRHCAQPARDVGETVRPHSADLSIDLLRGLAVFIIFAWPFIEMLQGYSYAKTGEVTKILSNVAALTLIGAALALEIVRGIKRSVLRGLIGTYALLGLFIIHRVYVLNYDASQLLFDLSTITRGLLVYAAARLLILSRHFPNCGRFCYNYLWYTWFLISLAVIISSATGFGLNTYEAFGEGSKAYFPSNNELTFVYSLAALCIALCVKRTYGAVVIAISCLVLFSIGTKAGFFLLAVGIALFVITSMYFEGKKALSLLLVAVIGGLLSLAWLNYERAAEQLARTLMEYSAGAGKMQEKLNYLDITSALWSQRDEKLEHALATFAGSRLDEWLFGVGFHTYAFTFYWGTPPRIAEVDVVDVLCGWGLIGIFFYLWLPFSQVYLGLRARNSNKGATALRIALVAGFFAGGILAGHVVLFSYPMIALAVSLSLADDRCRRESVIKRLKPNSGVNKCGT